MKILILILSVPCLIFGIHYTEHHLQNVCTFESEIYSVKYFTQTQCEDPDRTYSQFVHHLDTILENETEKTIGYSGHGQQGRVFQDVIKGVCRVILGMDIPDDFHFLRTPGQRRYDYITGNPKKDFLEKRYWPDERIQNWLFEAFFQESPSSYTQLEKEKMLLVLPGICDQYREKIYAQFGYKYETQADFTSENSAIFDFYTFIMNLITPILEKADPSEHDTIVGEILRFAWGNDMDEGFGSTLMLSMNAGLFSGGMGGENCLPLFLVDSTGISEGQRFQENDYRSFFADVGLSPDDYQLVVDAANRVLQEEGVKGGVLLQVFDTSEDRSLMDQVSYLSLHSGMKIPNAINTPTSDYIDGKIAHTCNMQIRLIIDHNHLLNPNSNIRIKRYIFDSPDGVDQKVMKAIESSLRKLPLDTKKRDAFKKALPISLRYQ